MFTAIFSKTFVGKVVTAVFLKICLDYVFSPTGPVVERVWSSPTV